jgi:WD40 repeat protein
VEHCGHQVGSTFDGSYVSFSPDGTQTVSCDRKVATVRNSSSREIVVPIPVVQDDSQHCCFSPDARLIAVNAGSIAQVWDITSSEPHLIETFIGHTGNITSLAFSSSSTLISGSIDQSVKFWKIGAHPADLVETDPKSISLTPVTIMSITLRAEDGISITSDSDGVVRSMIFHWALQGIFPNPSQEVLIREISNWSMAGWFLLGM